MAETSKLLANISLLRHKLKLDQNSTGSSFNLFKIIDLTTDEVRLHSQIIAELLNPKGSHGQGALFLEKFIESTGTHGILQDLDGVNVIVEFSIGPVTNTTGGRIDILLRDQRNNLLIIENKIYAGDQENQLLRYFNFAKSIEEKGGHFAIIYLTLFEKAASDYSLGNTLTHDDYISISYQQTIVDWLESCTTSVSNVPNVAVGIDHYLKLIKHLTFQDYSMEFQNNIIDEILKDVSSFKAANDISQNILDAKVRLLSAVGNSLVERLKKNEKVVDIFFDPNFGRQYKGLEIFIDKLEPGESRPPHIRFSFLRNASDSYLEIHPGFSNGEIIPKNHTKRLEYIKLLNDHFDRSLGKVMNVENYWQGEWVMEYHRFNNRFEDIIVNIDSIVDEIISDLNFLIDQFYQVERNC